MPVTPLLDTVTSPSDMRGLTVTELKQLADELRAETIDAVSETGGHLGAGLGVVELTVALHHVYETPKDILIWDVGHQAYPHKIHPSPGRRPLGFHPPLGERVRPVRGRARRHLDLGGPGLLRGARPGGPRQQGGGGDRRRLDERRHGL
jgi:hypothetical protein